MRISGDWVSYEPLEARGSASLWAAAAGPADVILTIGLPGNLGVIKDVMTRELRVTGVYDARVGQYAGWACVKAFPAVLLRW